MDDTQLILSDDDDSSGVFIGEPPKVTKRRLESQRRASKAHDRKRSETRKDSTKQVRFKDANELALFEALLEQFGDSAVGIFRAWMAEKLIFEHE